MRKQKTKRRIIGISLFTVMGMTLLAPGAGMNEVKAISTPSDAGIDADATSISSDMEIVTAPAASPVAIDSTNFPDKAFREWVGLNCDKNSDGQLSQDEISQCTTFDVREKGITSLQGIEYFSDLRQLICFSNNLSSLDVRSNTALETLDCGGNNLSSLDVRSNTALETLDCYKNNLSSLDVSHNTALRLLHCDNNNLSSLDVSSNTALTYLACSNNNLSSLDVSSNTALTYLACSNNNLSSLDVSHNTALMDLYCDNNKISSLDVSHNTALRLLHCDNNNLSGLDVSHNTALTVLYCYNNKISSLDVSHNTALRLLYCYNNKISSLDVSHNTALITLICDNNNLSSLDVSHNTALTALSCDSNKISSLDVSHNTALRLLYCYNNKISSLDLSKNTNLTDFRGDRQIISVPMYKNGDEYYIDLSKLPLDKERVSIDTAWMTEEGTAYDSTSGRINLSEPKDVDDTVRYLYETNGPASLSNTKMTVTVEISEVKDITEPTTEQPTTEQPTTEEPTTEKPAMIVPPTTPTDNSNVPTPKTGDTTPLYLVISLLLASFAGGVTLYIRRRKKL